MPAALLRIHAMSSVTLNNQQLTPSNDALVMVVRACMGFGSAAGVGGQSGFRSDSKRKYATAAHLWERYPANLAAVCQRLQGVIIENKDALAVMRAHDAETTLHYIDRRICRKHECKKIVITTMK
jgi:site-specific DNA-adenine methylase